MMKLVLAGQNPYLKSIMNQYLAGIGYTVFCLDDASEGKLLVDRGEQIDLTLLLLDKEGFAKNFAQYLKEHYTANFGPIVGLKQESLAKREKEEAANFTDHLIDGFKTLSELSSHLPKALRTA
ncbi:hypothetical protein [Nitritalea halalkaliphila]|nr:hypothetical protein [Nitritalea halalkaliphila]